MSKWAVRKEVRSAIIDGYYAQVRRMSVPGMRRRVYFWAVVSPRGVVKKQGSVARKDAGDKRTYYEIAMGEAERCAQALGGKARKNPAFGKDYWTPAKRMKAARAARAAIEKTAAGGIRPSLKAPKLKKTARENAGFARVRRIMLGQVPSVRTVGILTAENPQAKELSAKQNRERNQRLVRGLREMGYGPIPLKGMYGIKETSFLVPNMTRKDTTGAGIDFDQESVIWASRRGEGKNAYMVWQFIKGDKTVQTRDVSLSGRDIQYRRDYFSEKKGRKFSIPFFDEKYAAKRYYRKALDQKKRQLAGRKPSWRKNSPSDGGVIQGPWKSKLRCAECGERPPHKGKDPRGRQAKLCKPCEDMFVEYARLDEELEERRKREARNRKAKIRRSKIKLVPKPRKNASYRPMLKAVGKRSNPGIANEIKAEIAACKRIERAMKKK